jgi:hypothetical protein
MENIDWDKCCLCQVEGNERVRNPKHDNRYSNGSSSSSSNNNNNNNNNNHGSDDDITQVYDNLATNLIKFHELGETHILQSIADDTTALAAILKSKNAVWHHSCKLMYNNTKLHRAQKRFNANYKQLGEPEKKLTRKSVETNYYSPPVRCQPGSEGSNQHVCIVCCTTDPDRVTELRQVTSRTTEEKLKKAAINSNDWELYIRVNCDLISRNTWYHTTCYNRIVREADTNSDEQPEQVSSLYTC